MRSLTPEDAASFSGGWGSCPGHSRRGNTGVSTKESHLPSSGPSTPIPSPISTGGGGDRFEVRVDAFALALLLTRATPPVLLDTTVEEVHLQTRHLGWRTDDLLIVGRVRPGVIRRLALQVKRTFTIAASDEDCAETIRGMWDDFIATDRFDAVRDRLGIVTLHGTAGLLAAFTSLLDCARAAENGADFRRRLELRGYLSQKAKSQHEALVTILQGHAAGGLDEDRFWHFLRVVTLLSFDLGTPSAQTEAVLLSLLAHTAGGDGDPQATAQAAWATLLELASTGRPAAASFRRETLPADLLARHQSIPTVESRELLHLIAHGRTVRDSIRATIGVGETGYSLERPASAAGLLDRLDEYRVVVVSGAAGSGKSALAKTVLARVEAERPVLAFQSVEFATAHLHETLSNAQSALTAPTLFALLAGHDRTMILIESVERLLEHSIRDAFAQLLYHVARLPGLCLVLTCRDYALETVRSALLGSVGLEHAVVDVPPISDDELDALGQDVPELAAPLRDVRLRALLRTPYLLDMASRLRWDDETLPKTVQAFREKCWRELVRDEAHAGGGMPQRREDAFIDVARRRAAELRPFVAPGSPDLEALDVLHRASLLERSPASPRLYAPAHDVLEDWAILRWLNDIAVVADDPAAALADAVGGLPAVRRGLRRWLAERLDMEPAEASALVSEIVHRTDLPPYFRDDSVVAVLLSGAAAAFLAGCEARIARGDRALLRQVVQLLRVACKAAPFGFPASTLSSGLLVPVGAAWAPTLEQVARYLVEGRSPTEDAEAGRDALLALGLVEDWARQVSVHTPSPPGADAAGRIVAAILPGFGDYGARELRKRVLEVLLRIPRHVPGFHDLAGRARGDDDRYDPTARDLGDLMTSTLGSAAVARDFPEVVIDQMRARLMMDGLEADVYDARPLDVGECFGIRDRSLSDFFPASALQGPFWALLRHHPRRAVDFIVELLNHAADWYGERRWPGHDLEPAIRVELDVPGTGPVSQWMNARLYALYRGASVGPNALQSALMALESWLLDVAELPTVDVERWLLYILRESNNVMASAVVASVCIAHPTRAGCAALALLSSREIIEGDRQRLASERWNSTEVFAGLNPSHLLYEDERRRANRLPHRREDLESLAVRLQLTGQRDAVLSLIDRHRAEIPDSDDEEDLVWRLTLHRMDVRGFRPVELPPTRSEAPDALAGQVYFGPGDPEPAVQRLVESRQAETTVSFRYIRLGKLAHDLWARPGAPEATDWLARLIETHLMGNTELWEQLGASNFADWRTILAEARSMSDAEDDTVPDFLRDGVPLVAAACLRDWRAEMTADELAWCAGRVARELLAGAPIPEEERGSSAALASKPQMAAVIPIIVAEAEIPLGTDRVELLVAALTHDVDRVADCAYAGAAQYLRPNHGSLALRCASAAVQEAEAQEEERRAKWSLRQSGATRPMEGAKRVHEAVRRALEGSDNDARAALAQLRLDTWETRLGASRACEVLARWPEWPESRASFERVAVWLAETWARDRREAGRGSRDYHREQDLRRRLARFVLGRPPEVARAVCASLVAQVAHTPREVADFIHELVLGAADRDEDSFWPLWQDFADATVTAPWVAHLRRDDPFEQPLLDRLFLTTHWRDGITHWRRLEGHAHRMDSLARRLPPVVGCVQAYIRFLFTIGRQGLPDAFLVVDELLQHGDSGRLAAHREIAFMLESLLAQFVYAEPFRLKSRPPLRDAVLRLLDALVAAGSSASYRMRDDFVTPLRLEQA